MQKKTSIYFILSVIGFFFLLTIPNTIAVSDTIFLEYNEKTAVKIYPKVKVDWSFTGTNPNVNITLKSYSESCYLGDSWSTIVSEGHVSDSDSWSVIGQVVCDPAEEENIPPFYFVFLNNDHKDQENTTVTYTLDVDQLIPGYNGIFIISSLAMVAIVAVALKKKYKN
ncbi:MAG: hypothetical protein ACTSP9_04165 [Promethearchaeota archaeon]